ncbi:MAG: TPM domain-containing protein [Undibacterium sp.]|nr:TPM domain-containing protein [Opitutaceae bacterium]
MKSIFPSTPPIHHPAVVAAIVAAEQKTSGEIRVVLSRKKAGDPVAAAQAEFTRLGMTATAARNGVLIFVAPASKNFAVIGDTGIHEKCGDAFWRLLAAELTIHFKRGDFTAGLVHGIEHAGKLLAENFPSQGDSDRNELPNDIEETK